MMTGQNTLEEGLSRIRHSFVTRLSGYSVDLLAFLAAPTSIETVDSALFALHKISGSAATLGFSELGMQSKQAEEILREDLTKYAYPSAISVDAVRVVYLTSQEILDASA